MNIDTHKSTGAAYALWIASLLGLCGLHRPYLGHYKFGFVYLITFGLSGVGQVFDLILIPNLVAEAKNGLLSLQKESAAVVKTSLIRTSSAEMASPSSRNYQRLRNTRQSISSPPPRLEPSRIDSPLRPEDEFDLAIINALIGRHCQSFDDLLAVLKCDAAELGTRLDVLREEGLVNVSQHDPECSVRYSYPQLDASL